jgi:hypothetical protein
MRSLQLFQPSPRRLAWMLALLLLLPLAQTAANWHLLSHFQQSQSEDSKNRPALVLDYCGQCVNAAALTGGAPESSGPKLPAPWGVHEVPQYEPQAQVASSRIRAYNSRAPPFSRF